MKARVMDDCLSTLGESPSWDEKRKCCYWVDIENGRLYEYSWYDLRKRYWDFPGRLTLAVAGQGNELILAIDTGIAKFNPGTGQLSWLRHIETPASNNRCNDGACDSSGRLWIGTMHLDHIPFAGTLYCVDNNLRVIKKLANVTISNGIAWTPDNKLMYYVDSPTRLIHSFLFDNKTGEISFEKNVICVPPGTGTPDGIAIEEEGMLWIAHWDGFGVYRWNPGTGELINRIDVPVPQVSSCAFVGEDLNYLLITTARENLSNENLAKYPQSGNVFLAKVSVIPFRH